MSCSLRNFIISHSTIVCSIWWLCTQSTLYFSLLLSIESQRVVVNMIHGFPASFGKGQYQRLLLAKKR